MSSPLAVPAELVRDAIAKIDSDGVLHPVTEAMRDWVAKVADGAAPLTLQQLPLAGGEAPALADGEPVHLSQPHGEWRLQKFVSGDADWLVVTDVTAKNRHETAELEVARCRSLGGMAATLAHDLNNQFNAVLALSAHLDEFIQDEGDRATIRELERGTKVGSRMASALARLLIRRPQVHEQFSSAEMLEDALSMVRKSLQLAGVDLQVEAAPDLPSLRGSAMEVVQSVMNGLMAFEHAGVTKVHCTMTRETATIANGRPRDCVILRCEATPWNEQSMLPLVTIINGDPGLLTQVANNPDTLEGVANATFAQKRMGANLTATQTPTSLQLTYTWPVR